jgi:multisubunit Na+/H+ antiporter MnhE subunit
MKKNVGRLDQFLRFCLAVFLIWLGLFYLDGKQGSVLGILVSICSLLPLYMVFTRKCFVFRWFNISSIGRLHKTKDQ